MGLLIFIVSQNLTSPSWGIYYDDPHSIAEEICSSEKWYKFPKATQPEEPGRGLKSVWRQSLSVIEIQEICSLFMGASGAMESPVAWVGPAGPFLLCKSTSGLCALKPAWLWVCQSPAWLELRGAGGQDTDVYWRLGFCWWGKARQDSGSVSQVTQSLLGFLLTSVSAPVSPSSPQTLFCQKVSMTELLMSNLVELPAVPQTPSPPRVRAVRVGKVMLGTPTSCNSQSLNIIFPWVSLFPSVSFMLHLQQGSAGRLYPSEPHKVPGWRRLCSSMCCHSPLGVGRGHVQLCTGSHSFHKEVTHITYARTSLAKPSHVVIALLEVGGEIQSYHVSGRQSTGSVCWECQWLLQLFNVVQRNGGSSLGH